ncbi:RNA-binding protein 7 isoform X1 [Cimex lectularius]|uniref:RRM domain-containing protein n=1 Tax=Cimex lectularius TaxID=79782 RepID=A0A8I6RIV0_CIMLE|nr:RNA-binding protein 7 isoform X1 [Cimex lectularius]
MDRDRRTLFVGNLSEHATEDILHELFLQAGPVQEVSIPQINGKPRAFGFVVFKHACSVPYAIALMNNISLYGRMLTIRTKKGTLVGPYTPQPILIGYINVNRFAPPQNKYDDTLRGMNCFKRSYGQHMKPYSRLNRHPDKHQNQFQHSTPELSERLDKRSSNQDHNYELNGEFHHEKKRLNNHSHKRHADQKHLRPKHLRFNDDVTRHNNRKGNSSTVIYEDPFFMKPYNF